MIHDKNIIHKKMACDKKAQIIGEIFTYILAAVVIGVIVLIGYWAINNITQKSCQVEQLNFKANIESLIEQYSSYGTFKKEILSAPCDYDTICFASADNVTNKDLLKNCSNPIIISSVQSGTLNNIFAISHRATFPIGYSAKVGLTDPAGCTCINSRSNNFYMTFSGEGFRTVIAES